MFTLPTKLREAGVASMAALCVLGAFAGSAAAAQDYHNEANAALAWVRGQQQLDGSFQGFGVGSTVDAALAIVAAGQDPASYSQSGNTPVTFLEGKVSDLAKTPGGAGKLLILARALARAGKPFNGVKSLQAALDAGYNPQTGQYGKDVIGHAFALLGSAALESVPPGAVRFLESRQTVDGGWAFSGETGAGDADTNTTAVAVQALLAVGGTDAGVLRRAQGYLASQQNPDGGYPYQKGGENGSESDANSTAYVIQALTALGADTARPMAFLASLQNPSGAFKYQASQPEDNAGATYQAVPALLGATLAAPRPGEAAQGPGVSPGMPSTGGDNPLPALAALAALLFGAGAALRRKAVAV